MVKSTSTICSQTSKLLVYTCHSSEVYNQTVSQNIVNSVEFFPGSNIIVSGNDGNVHSMYYDDVV